jgi:hypothetical protein
MSAQACASIDYRLCFGKRIDAISPRPSARILIQDTCMTVMNRTIHPAGLACARPAPHFSAISSSRARPFSRLAIFDVSQPTNWIISSPPEMQERLRESGNGGDLQRISRRGALSTISSLDYDRLRWTIRTCASVQIWAVFASSKWACSDNAPESGLPMTHPSNPGCFHPPQTHFVVIDSFLLLLPPTIVTAISTLLPGHLSFKP